MQGGHYESAKLKHLVQAWLDAWMIRSEAIDLQTERNHSAPSLSVLASCGDHTLRNKGYKGVLPAGLRFYSETFAS